MIGLKNFLISEELRSDHAERFLLYQERYHHQILLDLKKKLEKAWTKTINALSRSHKIKSDDLEYALLQNPKSTCNLELDVKTEKLQTPRHRDPIDVSPSVKIPLLFQRAERDLMIKEILNSAEDTFKSLTSDWSEIFKIEKKGRVVPWFKISKDHDEVRLQLVVSTDNQEVYKTLYAVRIEFGRTSSKTRDFDRVYLVSLL